MIIIPEFVVELDEVVEHLNARRQQGKTFSIIAVSEGAEVGGLPTPRRGAPLDAFGHEQLSRRGIGERLGRQVEDVTGFETRSPCSATPREAARLPPMTGSGRHGSRRRLQADK